MKQLSVSNDAFNSYVKFFKSDINKTISSLYNEDFVITTDDEQLSFVFLDALALVLILKSDTIHDISYLSYDHLISESFIKEIMRIPNLSPRLKRYKELGKLRFKEEIIENFQLGNFCVDKNQILWTDYNLKFKLSNSLMLENIN